jgi:formylglycine-generating enzyme required for sulfatase activity
VQDSHRDSYDGALLDGSLAVEDAGAPRRVLRGGSWCFDPRNLRSADRGKVAPVDRREYVGFRVARMLTP